MHAFASLILALAPVLLAACAGDAPPVPGAAPVHQAQPMPAPAQVAPAPMAEDDALPAPEADPRPFVQRIVEIFEEIDDIDAFFIKLERAPDDLPQLFAGCAPGAWDELTAAGLPARLVTKLESVAPLECKAE